MRTHGHTVEEYVEILVHGADVLIDRQIESYPFLFQAASEPRGRYRVVYAVVNVEKNGILLTDAASPHVCFIRKDQCR